MSATLALVPDLCHKRAARQSACNTVTGLTSTLVESASAMSPNTQNLFACQAPLPEAVAKRFWLRVEQRGPDECWPWLGCFNQKGYGRLSVAMNGKTRNLRATHIALALTGVARPADMHALHSCDNPACVNPRHLRWGTNSDNVRDRILRGRRGAPGAKLGEAHFNAKLSVEQVRAIRACDQNPAITAAVYGVSRKTVYDIKAGTTWSNVA